ncbi:hypothetical protein UA08_04417 [Talaromyces atroroseus]|uniref:AMP-dependent synthetase/ligase domain-containing protein n=1 Tax=Talaromyces atroroseus TaxID=1441469 RepID=A0A1Q5Q9A7_TALAT|nr:hypothetical protein UA08_04417 [Talaromyces atroroseus]OKL60695.1 hypothetical protein UA08_04417 [Talaromyces atroroseus]
MEEAFDYFSQPAQTRHHSSDFYKRRSFTYGDLTRDIARSREQLLQKYGSSLSGQRVAFLAENSYDYVVMLFSILASDAIALPLSPGFPAVELKYILENSGAGMLLATEKYAGKARELVDQSYNKSGPIVDIRPKILTQAGAGKSGSAEQLRDIRDSDSESKGGLMLYTSGTTNRPKGVFLPLSAILAQTQSLIEAWRYSPQDYLLHLLPLHHIHGLVNAVIVPALAGSSIEFMYPFNPDAVWHRLADPFLQDSGEPRNNKISFLTAVPTLYTRLMAAFPSLPADVQTAAKQAIAPHNLRLNISGSAALPTPIKKAWTELSNGNVLLERYGMTEVGMAISCGLDPNDRVDGSVGWPLPSVEVRLWDTDKGETIKAGEEVDDTGRERVGEIQLRGPTIFREYWGNPKATAESFVADEDNDSSSKGAWFRTGDVAVRRAVEGSGSSSSGEWAKGPMYFIQGRLSVDIIKTGGEKVSALEVERELLSLPQIAEAAVVGLPSERWGQKVAAVIVLSQDSGGGRGMESIMAVRRALRDRLAMHKLPQELKVLAGPIPRNAMGKVNKKALIREVFGDISV